ncbi:MAG: PilZ domain-containing protein [Deltaproteobacteria bacterium]
MTPPPFPTSSSRGAAPTGADKRRHPRAPIETKVHLSAGPGGKSFQATLPTIDVSLGGIFFQSEFSLRLGSELRVAFAVPGDEREIEAEGVVVRVEQYDDRRRTGRNGFAVRFTRFEGDGAIALASLFLAPKAREFASRWLKERSRAHKARPELASLVDLLIAWELERTSGEEPVTARR